MMPRPEQCGSLDHPGVRAAARRPLRATLVTAALLLVLAGPARAADTICTGPLDPAGSPYGNVVVPAGMTCAIIGVRVNGNVTVSGSLIVAALVDDATIRGNVNTKDGCGTVRIFGATPTLPEPAPTVGTGRVVIGGNVTIDHCQEGNIGSAGPGAPAIDGIAFGPLVLIGKNLKCTDNTGRCLLDHVIVGGNVELSGNDGPVVAAVSSVGGNLTAKDNGSSVQVLENAIGGDLKCNGNVGPVSELLDTVAGSKQGQCAAP